MDERRRRQSMWAVVFVIGIIAVAALVWGKDDEEESADPPTTSTTPSSTVPTTTTTTPTTATTPLTDAPGLVPGVVTVVRAAPTGSTTAEPEVVNIWSDQHRYVPSEGPLDAPDESPRSRYVEVGGSGERCFRAVAYNAAGAGSSSAVTWGRLPRRFGPATRTRARVSSLDAPTPCSPCIRTAASAWS